MSRSARRANRPVPPARLADLTNLHFFCPSPRGLEQALCEELAALGGQHVKASGGGASCVGPLALGYRINLRSRIASRVLMQVALRRVRDEQDLYALTLAQPWELYFAPTRTLRVDLTAIRSPWRSLNFATLRVKDGICDRMRMQCGSRPSIDTATPDVRIQAFVEDGMGTLYIDLSGEPLFKRGWRNHRDAHGDAPLKENLAAGLLALARWTPDQSLIDPFCGSGTIVIEAAQIALGRAPGLGRSFATAQLTIHDPATEAAERQAAEALASGQSHLAQPSDATAAVSPAATTTRARAVLIASDRDPEVIAKARRNALAAGVPGEAIAFSVADATALNCPDDAAPGIILGNPPYGERVQMDPTVWQELGERLRAQFGGWRALFITSDRTLPGRLGLRERRKTPLYNGTIDCRLFEFEMRVRETRRTEHEPERAE